MTKRLIDELIEIAENLQATNVIIGGMALPAYSVTRTTLDIDFCIFLKDQVQLDRFLDELKKRGITTMQSPKIEYPMFYVFTGDRRGEGEIWLTPCDKFAWDEEMVERVRKFKGKFNVLSPEDFIVAKLGRADRSSIDIDDVMQILQQNNNTIDWEYLRRRAKWAKVVEILEEIIEMLKEYAPGFGN